MPNERWTINTPEGGFDAYVAKPDTGISWPAVVVIQEIFGVNHVMRETCDRLARAGYLAVCPDLFWRLTPNVELTDKTQAEWDEALALMGRFDIDNGVRDIQWTIDQVRASFECSGKVGAVGYCLGGHLAFLAACRTTADCAVGYYGVNLQARLGEEIRRPLMLHIAEEDSFTPPAARDQVVAALSDHPKVTLHVYPERDHAFARPGGKHHHPGDAGRANDRTLEFFRTHL